MQKPICAISNDSPFYVSLELVHLDYLLPKAAFLYVSAAAVGPGTPLAPFLSGQPPDGRPDGVSHVWVTSGHATSLALAYITALFNCGINFQTPHEVLSHRQLEHPPPPPSESQPESVADRNMDIPTSDKPGLIDDSDNAATVPENVADVTSSCTDNVTSVADGSGGVEDITNLAAASCNVSSQIVSEKTVEKFLLSSCLGRMGEVSARKVAKSKMTLEELEKQLCRNNAIIKAKAEAAIRELSLTRKGRNSAANTRWGVQRYKFVVPDRQPSSDKNKEKVVLQADDKYNYPLIRKVSNSRFASLTERKKKLGSKPESLSCDKDKEKREKDVLEPDSSSVDVYEFDDDDSATKGISLRGVAVLPTCKSIMQGKEYDAHTDSGKDCVQQTVVSTEQNTTKSVISDMPCDKLDNYVSDCNFRVQQLELGSEITCSDQNVFSEENVIKENTCTHQELQCVTKVMVTEGLNKFVCGTEKCLNCKELVREEGEKPEVNELYKCPKSSEQKALSGVEVSNISVKNSVKNNKAKLGTNRKLVQKQNANDQGIENNKESKSVKSSKKRKTNESFELPPSKHTFQADSSKSEPQEIMPLGRRQVKKVSYVELYDSEVDEQFLFYSDDEIPPLNDSKLKPKCKNPKKKQSKSDRKKRKYDQPVVQQGESCGSETVTHVHKKRCKQKLQSVDVSSSAPKSDDISETCRIESPVIEANKFQPKWLCTSEPVTDEDNTSESDQSDRQKTTKTDLLKTVFAKSRRNSTTIVSGSGGTIPEVDEGRTNTHSVKHKHRSVTKFAPPIAVQFSAHWNGCRMHGAWPPAAPIGIMSLYSLYVNSMAPLALLSSSRSFGVGPDLYTVLAVLVACWAGLAIGRAVCLEAGGLLRLTLGRPGGAAGLLTGVRPLAELRCPHGLLRLELLLLLAGLVSSGIEPGTGPSQEHLSQTRVATTGEPSWGRNCFFIAGSSAS
ncbi:hypothetical protein PR048_027874 [Dryococelus australis]|uniref:Uncharacterized protein n=1 Tax=Dryococelus australis TaxID=614101 RepID=A0ABQ9GHQ7_9NEOP|nr:hypothetical protein PR048_027874 [Dryococelus australis]